MSFVLSSSRPIARRPTDGRPDGRTAVCGGGGGGFPVASAAQQNPQFLTKLANRSRTLAHARANFDFFRTFTSVFLRSHEFCLQKKNKKAKKQKRIAFQKSAANLGP
jgi:hypothetical protein